MVIDFSEIGTDVTEQPVLVLRNLDGTAIQTLGYAFNLKVDLCYNEVSTITFDIPAYAEGIPTPHYDDIIGTRIIDMVGWGQFILVNPKVEKDGIKEIKSCTAYSLEYEFSYKKLSVEDGTYNFWNPTAPDGSILQIIMSYLPSWKIGSVDNSLWGKYRTFSVDYSNVYDFIKSTLQTTYSCIFEFDTYARKVNVRSAADGANPKPVFISLSNLAKEINLEEDTENIFTVLDVNGAEDVNIRSVNPMGTNKIYNLDYYMNTSHFSQEMIDKWSAWKQTFEDAQLSYYNTTVEKMMKISEIVVAEHTLSEMEDVDMAKLENERAVLIEYLASVSSPDAERQARLTELNTEIANLTEKIDQQKTVISNLNSEKDTLTAALEKINKETAFQSFFTDDEMLVLNRYFKEDSIEETSFVCATVSTYADTGVSSDASDTVYSISSSSVTRIPRLDGKEIYTVQGGVITAGSDMTANLIRASVEKKSDGGFVLAAYLGNGALVSNSFVSGCLSVAGECGSITSDVVPDAEVPGAYSTGTSLSFTTTEAKYYFTKDTTEYEQQAVEWDLFEYGMDMLGKLSYPSYSFSISSGNFFALDDYISFVKQIALGQKIYLEIDEEKSRVLSPILVKISLDFEDLSSLQLEFGDTYNISDSSFNLVDLLEQSISMGKTVDTSRFSYNSFIDSGASTTVKDFIDSALDVSKNNILSGNNMAISWDSSGLHFRKSAAGGGYEPEQIAVINNSIVFTDDAWSTAKMAIGKFTDTNIGDAWGVIAPSIVGTLLAGNNLVIESTKKDGGVSVFRVDADGAVLHNARFDIEDANRHIVLDPKLGFAIGYYPLITQDDDGNDIVDIGTSDDPGNAKFWVDTDGNVHMRGTLEGCNGKFSGELSAATGTFSGELKGGSIDIGDGNFVVDSDGNLTAKSGRFEGDIYGANYYDKNGNSMTKNGKFSSDYLDLGNIQLDGSTGEITLTGSINFTGGAADSIKSAADDGALSIAQAAQDTANAATTKADSAYSQAYDAYTVITSNSVTAAKLRGGTVELLNSSENILGVLKIGAADTSNYAIDLESYSSLRLLAQDSSTLYISGGSCSFTMSGGTLFQNGYWVFSSSNWGSLIARPASGATGQVYFVTS